MYYALICWWSHHLFVLYLERLFTFPRGNGEAVTAFGCLVSDMWLGEFACVSPEGFHSVLGKRYPTFSKRTQQDAQEFLICVLNELHEALKKVRAQLWCFGDCSCFLFALSDLAFPVKIACLPVLNYTMQLLKNGNFIFFCFEPTHREQFICFLSNATSSCSPYLNDNAVSSSIIVASPSPCSFYTSHSPPLSPACLPCPHVCLSLLQIH